MFLRLTSPPLALPISFLSDFGLQDEFVGVVHGVIARLSPDAQVIDVTHGISPGDVRGGALALTRAIQYLPQGVVLAVVDPGVGTARKALALDTEAGFFVGPDNGLLSPAVALVGGASAIHSIENPDVIIPAPGVTFQGRDVFGPAAALLSSGEATPGRPGTCAESGIGYAVDASAAERSSHLWSRARCSGSTGMGTSKPTSVPTTSPSPAARPDEVLEVRVGSGWHDAGSFVLFGDVAPRPACGSYRLGWTDRDRGAR